MKDIQSHIRMSRSATPEIQADYQSSNKHTKSTKEHLTKNIKKKIKKKLNINSINALSTQSKFNGKINNKGVINALFMTTPKLPITDNELPMSAKTLKNIKSANKLLKLMQNLYKTEKRSVRDTLSRKSTYLYTSPTRTFTMFLKRKITFPCNDYKQKAKKKEELRSRNLKGSSYTKKGYVDNNCRCEKGYK